LELRAHQGIDPAALERCSFIAPGEGLCGRVAQSRQVEVAPNGERCGESNHECVGNCCVPVMHGDELLGVLGVYFELDRQRDSTEAQLLLSVANVLAGVIERKRVERLKLEHERVALARERMARVGALSAGLAHTVRNPLHGVMSCLEILEGQARRGQPAADEIIALMRDGLHRIERTTRRLLGLTRDVAPVRKPVRVDVLLQDVVDIMRLQARDRSVALELGDAWAGEAMLDPDGVVEALSAVVTNALLACESGGKVVVSARIATAPAGLLCIEVRDDGVGIAEQDLPRVLEPFFTTRPVTEASGLGLAIARRIMDEHQGEIELTSQLGRGTTVGLTFPSALDVPDP
jgi:signal transduction histidine kinase